MESRLSAAKAHPDDAAESDRSNRLLVSALSGDGVPELIAKIESLLPESPFYYPADEISTLPVRFFAAELVRETVLEQLRVTKCPTASPARWKNSAKDRSPKFIRAVIYVERESQKGIVVGAKGAAIKKIGEQSRKRSNRSSVIAFTWSCTSRFCPTGAAIPRRFRASDTNC